MNGKIQLLAVVALVQLVVIGILWFSGGESAQTGGPWISLERDSVSRLEVRAGDEVASVSLGTDGWEIDGLPADEGKVGDMLDKLAGLEAPWPVATSDDAVARFEVGEDDYQRRVQVFAGEEIVVDLLLGTSPGYQRVHARQAGGSDIFSVELSNYELPTNTDGWLDKSLFSVTHAPSSVVATFSDGRKVNLAQTEEGWLIDGQPADQDVTRTYVDRFKTMNVLGIHTSEKALESQAIIELNDPVDVVLEILREAEEGDYVVRGDKYDNGFRLATYTAEQLLMTDVIFNLQQESPEQDQQQDQQQTDEQTDG